MITKLFQLVLIGIIYANVIFADDYIIKGHQPTVLYVIQVNNMTGAERTMIGTLQGIIAKTEEEQIYICFIFKKSTHTNTLICSHSEFCNILK